MALHEQESSPERGSTRLRNESVTDDSFMRRAIELGRRGWGRTHPNPLVGCVLVSGERIVGEGWHAEFGGPHAEAVAIQSAGAEAEGATAYISLEPCRHHGKTPPCTDALRRAGIRRVVYGARDPGPDSGGGADELRENGLQVTGPTLDDDRARWENPVFLRKDRSRPWLALKLATSLDARIAARPGVRTHLSGPEALDETHRLRAGFDGILVGTETVSVDDPLLTVRGTLKPRIPPRRIFLDATGRIDPSCKLFREGEGPVWVVTTEASGASWRADVESAGGRLIEVEARPDGRPELAGVLSALGELDIRSVLCEGGGRLGAALLAENLVDRLYLTMVPGFLGPEGVPAFPFARDDAGDAGAVMDAGTEWRFGEPPRALGEDVWMALEPSEGD